MTTRTANALVGEALARTTWGKACKHRATIFDDMALGVAENDLLITVTVPDKTGSPRYAKRANDLVQRLYDTERFIRVEADIPVPSFDPRPDPSERAARAGGAGGCGAGSSNRDWALKEMRVPQALAFAKPSSSGGRGIRIGHPDSGYSSHHALGLAHLDLNTDRDVIKSDDDARDPLRKPKASIFNALPNSGHGTSTASVIVGSGEGSFCGVAKEATLVPIRATESVVQVFDTDVAKAVRWARRVGCHVVSMSLGGKGLFGLHDAIQEAVDDGMIVMAAAGNQVRFVTAPASYDNCIAVGATGPGAKPWSGSSRGDAVDVCAPGNCVWAALFDWDASPPVLTVGQSDGTSYAVAHLAGVASLWLAHHGRDKLIATFGKANIQALFLYMLGQPGVCNRPTGWDAGKWGVGVIDAEALLRAALPQPFQLGGRRARAGGAAAADDPLGRIASHVDAPIGDVANWVDDVLGQGASSDLGLLHRFEGELTYLLATDPTFAAGLVPDRTRLTLGRRAPMAARPVVRKSAAMSPQLRRRMKS